MTPAHAQAAEALLRSALEPNLLKRMGGEELSRVSQASPCKGHHNMCIAPTCHWCTGCTGCTTLVGAIDAHVLYVLQLGRLQCTFEPLIDV